MKIAKIIYSLLIFFLAMSCIKTVEEEDSRYFSSENEWIYDVMQNNYLFRDGMPSNVDFKQEPTDFFYSILDKSQDNNKKKTHTYSRIEVLGGKTKSVATEATGYGFEFISYHLLGHGIMPRVLYVIPNSPAEKAGLKRGDYIHGIDNVGITSHNLYALYSGNEITLTVSETASSQKKEIAIDESKPVINKPLHMYKVIENNGNKIAYVVYNHFTSGIGDNSSKDSRYNDELCAMSNELAAAGVTEMVLDLRYNGGGQIDCAQLLSTIIAPRSAIDKRFCTIVNMNGEKRNYSLDMNVIRNGSNLNLKRLLVLTSEFTASASELIINCLRPYMEVIIIGDVTEGKNVGSCDYKHKNFNYILKPIMCYVYNGKGEADYSNGFTPKAEHKYKDIENGAKQYSLGDTREMMLQMALGVINRTKTKASEATTSTPIKYNYTFTPLTNGININ